MHTVNDHDASSEQQAAEQPGDPSPAPVWIAPAAMPRAAVLLLHGLDMTAAQLAPILRSLQLPALIALPSGPVERVGGRRAWWPVDDTLREARLQAGPTDLHDSHPKGRARARDVVHATALALRARAPGQPLIVAGFSQGAMLALDCVCQTPPLSVDALALWSASRLAFTEWAPTLHRLRGVRVDLLHGRADANLGIAAGRSLRNALVAEQADVRWAAFEGGHEIPLQAWVGLRRLVREMAAPS